MNAIPSIDVYKTAKMSVCGRYRYLLMRSWGQCGYSGMFPETLGFYSEKYSRPMLPFVMLNPSTADAAVDDPTIRRCMGFARREGFGGIMVANLYAFRAKNPDDLWRADDPYGPENDSALLHVANYAYCKGVPIVCGWGVHGGKNNRPIALMQQMGARLVCLGRTKGGYPRHPLYVRADQSFEDYP
jgi:hypothetical protein